MNWFTSEPELVVDPNALYYFLSTVAQSFAAILAVLVTGYIFAVTRFDQLRWTLADELWKAQSKGGAFVGDFRGLLADSKAHLDSFGDRVNTGDGYESAASYRKRFDRVTVLAKRLKDADMRHEKGLEIPRLFVPIAVPIFSSLVALPFVPRLKSCILGEGLIWVTLVGVLVLFVFSFLAIKPIFAREIAQ